MLFGEAEALGMSLAGPIAADTSDRTRLPTVAGFVEIVTTTFSPPTATYRGSTRSATTWSCPVHQH